MSDAGIRQILDQMDAWLADPNREWEPEDLTAWNEVFNAAAGSAERGPGWPSLVQRAHELGERLNLRMATVILERDAVKAELDGQALGNRALKAYGSNAR